MMTYRNKLILNCICTPDGTLLISKHRHDFVSHTDANGHVYSIDGGIDYNRISWTGPLPENRNIYLEDPDCVERGRYLVTWGTYGKDGKGPLTWIKIADMTTEHIRKCLETQTMMHVNMRKFFEMELDYRTDKGL